MRILLTGGGTGGHLMPLVAVAQKIKEKNSDCEFIFIGPKSEIEERIMAAAQISVRHVFSGKIRRYFSFQNLVDVFKLPIGIIQALWLLLSYMPDAIFSKGGYGSVPVVLVGWLYRIPILIHESDSNPGMANSMLAKFCERVAISYPEAEKYFPASQVVLTGNPLRSDINQGDASRAREIFSLLESKKVIFIMGGSLGARSINNKILNILPQLLHRYQIIHQTGEVNYDQAVHKAGELGIKAEREGYHPIAFIGDEMKDILAVSDLIISRAGASSLSEIAANGKPSIIIPLESAANNHQRMNAYSLAKNGACVVLEESNLGEHMLMNKIDELMENEELRAKLSQNIRQFYHPDAADKIAEGVLGMVK